MQFSIVILTIVVPSLDPYANETVCMLSQLSPFEGHCQDAAAIYIKVYGNSVTRRSQLSRQYG